MSSKNAYFFNDMSFLVARQSDSIGKNKNQKLTCTFFDQKNYLIHINMLKLLISNGYELKKIHNALTGNQNNIIKPYIDLNNKNRRIASINKDEVGITHGKLMNNSTYRKLNRK